jgi:hypothetical protein
MRLAVRILFFILALAVAWFDPKAVGRASSEIVTFAAIVSAGAISALIFAGSILGARAKEKILEGFEARFWGENHNFWFLMFASAALSSVLVIIGQMINWELALTLVLWQRTFTLSVGAIVAFSALMSLGMAVSLMLDFSKAIEDILKISLEDSAGVRRTPTITLDEASVAETIKTRDD